KGREKQKTKNKTKNKNKKSHAYNKQRRRRRTKRGRSKEEGVQGRMEGDKPERRHVLCVRREVHPRMLANLPFPLAGRCSGEVRAEAIDWFRSRAARDGVRGLIPLKIRDRSKTPRGVEQQQAPVVWQRALDAEVPALGPVLPQPREVHPLLRQQVCHLTSEVDIVSAARLRAGVQNECHRGGVPCQEPIQTAPNVRAELG